MQAQIEMMELSELFSVSTLLSHNVMMNFDDCCENESGKLDKVDISVNIRDMTLANLYSIIPQ